MRALLDTHALLWWLAADPALSAAAIRLISNPANTMVVSAASAWEIATKVRIGRLPTAVELVAVFEAWLRRNVSSDSRFRWITEFARDNCPGRTKIRLTGC